MVQYIRKVKRVWQREWKRILDRPTLYLMTIVLPQVLFFYFGWIYSEGNVRNIPLVVYDGDRSEFSRLLVRSFEASGTFRIVEVVATEKEIEEAFRRGIAQAAIVIPKDIERSIKSGMRTTVILCTNGANFLLHNTALKEMSSIVKTYSTGLIVRKMRIAGMSEAEAFQKAYPIRVDVHPLYNAYYNYAQFIGVGLLPAIFQILIMMVAVLLISSEFTHDTFSELVATADENVVAILLGKSLPYFLLHMVTAVGLLKVIFPIFHISVVGSMGALFFLFFLFIGASHFMGLALSSLFHNQQLATEIVFFINIPAFIFSGYIFPLWAMPSLHRIFAEVLPFTHFLYSYVQLQTMGLSYFFAAKGCVVLVLFWLVSGIFCYVILRHEIQKLKFPPQSLLERETCNNFGK